MALFETLEARQLLAADLVADINVSAASSSNPREFTRVGETTFFVADTELGAELWKTDGTEAGTQLVKDIHPGPGSSNPTDLTESNGLLFFEVRDGIAWRSDGTEAGTFLLQAMPMDFSRPGGKILAVGPNGVLLDRDLVSDGSTVGTNVIQAPRLTDVFGSNEQGFVASDSRTFFLIDNEGIATPIGEAVRFDERITEFGYVQGNKFFHFVIAPDETTQVSIFDTTENSLNRFSIPQTFVEDSFVRSGDNVFFATTEIPPAEPEVPEPRSTSVWKLDANGSTEPDLLHTFVGSSPDERFDVLIDNTPGVPGTVWFVARSATDIELWRSDGTAEGTVPLVAPAAPDNMFANPRDLAFANGRLWFLANDADDQPQVWITDGTAGGTLQLTTISAETAGDPKLLYVEGGRAYFSAPSDSGVELWESDGTREGTTMFDIRSGVASSFPTEVSQLPDGEFLVSAIGSEGRELFRTTTSDSNDPRSIVSVKDINATADTVSSSPNNLIAFQDKLFFAARTDEMGSELWMSDGTEAGTSLVRDIHPGIAGAAPRDFKVIGDTLFFVADDGVHGNELWVSDGTPDGTRLAVDLFSGSYGSFPTELTAFDGALYFTSIVKPATFRGNDELRSMFRVDTDGSVTTVRELPEPTNTRTASRMFDLTVFNERLYFYEFKQVEEDIIASLQSIDGTGDVITIEPLLHRRNWDILDMAASNTALAYLRNDQEGTRPEIIILDVNGNSKMVGEVNARLDGELQVSDTHVWIPESSETVVARIVDNEITKLTNDANFLETQDGLFAVGGPERNQNDILNFGQSPEALEQIATFGDERRLPGNRPRLLTEFQDDVYFVVDALGDEFGEEVWRSDGTAEGTMPITKLDTTLLNARQNSLTVVNNKLFFALDDGVHGRELWVFDTGAKPGDLDGDGFVRANDIDLLFGQIGEPPSVQSDLNEDSIVDKSDVDTLVRLMLRTDYGDANLDNAVDFTDFLVLSAAFSQQGTSWSQGDFTGDGLVDFADFLLLSTNFGFRL